MRFLLAGTGLAAVGIHVAFPWLLALDQLLGGGPMSVATRR